MVLFARLALIVLAACIPTLATAADGADAWVVLSVSRDMSYGRAQIRIRSMDDPNIRHLMGFHGFSMIASTWHEWGEKKSGYVYSRKFPPGRYEIYNFNLHYEPVKTDFWSKKDFSVPFELKAGEVAYLGEFTATGTVMKPVIFIPNVKTPYFLWADEQARDMAIAVKENPEIDGLPVRAVSMKGQRGTAFIRTVRPKEE